MFLELRLHTIITINRANWQTVQIEHIYVFIFMFVMKSTKD